MRVTTERGEVVAVVECTEMMQSGHVSLPNGLGLDYPDRYKERVGKVTAADVQRVAAKYFDPDTFNRVVVGKAP